MIDTTPPVLRKAIDAAIRLDAQLNILLDAYDFYCERYPAQTKSQEIELADLQASIKELGQLPSVIALTLTCWRTHQEPPLSEQGFEINVMNEITVHLVGLSRFFTRKGIDLEPYSDEIIYDIIGMMNVANKHYGKPQHEAQ